MNLQWPQRDRRKCRKLLMLKTEAQAHSIEVNRLLHICHEVSHTVKCGSTLRASATSRVLRRQIHLDVLPRW
jgi:hypothetical protein